MMINMSHIYFKNSSYTAQSLKKERKKLSFKYHPDSGGTDEEFVGMMKEYEDILNDIGATPRTDITSDSPRREKSAPKKEPEKEAYVRSPPVFWWVMRLEARFLKVSKRHSILLSKTLHTIFSLFLLFLGFWYISMARIELAYICIMIGVVLLLLMNRYVIFLASVLLLAKYLNPSELITFNSAVVIPIVLLCPILLARLEYATDRTFNI
jgi:hypothetical protein